MMTSRSMFHVLGVWVLLGCLSPHSDAQNPSTSGAKSDSDPAVGKKSASLDMVRFDVQKGWRRVESAEKRVVYLGNPGDVHYITFNSGAADLPALTDVTALQNHFRTQAVKETGGLMSVDVTKVQGRDAVVYYTKQILEPIRGYRYVARCVIPIDEAWFEIRMDAIEMTPAIGAREASVSVKLTMDNELEYEEIPPDAAPLPGAKLGADAEKPRGKRIKGWFKDPYDPKFDSSAMCSVADDKEYDKAFPEHPISRLRRTFPKVLEKLQISPAIPRGAVDEPSSEPKKD